MDQRDVKGEFLPPELPEADRSWTRLRSLEGASIASGELVEFLKSLYGIRQASKLWYEHLRLNITGIGLLRSASSDFLFHSTSVPRVYIFMSVDDRLILGLQMAVRKVKKQTKYLFTVTDIGPCS